MTICINRDLVVNLTSNALVSLICSLCLRRFQKHVTDRASFAIHLQGVHFQGRVVLLNGCVGRLQNDICVRSVFPSTDNDVVVIGLVGVRGCMIAGTSEHTRSIPSSFKEFDGVAVCL